MPRLIFLALLILTALPLRAEQPETIRMTSEAISERLGNDSLWHLSQLNSEIYVYTRQSTVYSISNGRFVLPTPCGQQSVPASPQLYDAPQDRRATAQPCIAIHTIVYDVIYIMAGSDTVELSDDGSITFDNSRGLVVLSAVQQP